MAFLEKKYMGVTHSFLLRRLTEFFALVCMAGCLAACSITKHVPTESQTVINYVDSVRFEVRDSIVLVPKEVYKDYAGLLDTLRMETEYAEACAWADTVHNILNGKLETKKAVEYRERIVYKDRVQYRDSIQVKEIPIEVEKIVYKTPKAFWWILAYSVLITLAAGLKIYLKIKK